MKRSLEFAKRVYEGYSAVIGVALLALFICYALDYNRTTAHWPSLLAAVVHMLGILFSCPVTAKIESRAMPNGRRGGGRSAGGRSLSMPM